MTTSFELVDVVSLSDSELSALRGTWCSVCDSRYCATPACDACGTRHSTRSITLDSGKPKLLCDACERYSVEFGWMESSVFYSFDEALAFYLETKDARSITNLERCDEGTRGLTDAQKEAMGL